jgi:hypothetical protein
MSKVVTLVSHFVPVDWLLGYVTSVSMMYVAGPLNVVH